MHLKSKFQDPSPDNSVHPDDDKSEIIDHNDFKNKSRPLSTPLDEVQSQSIDENDVRSIYNTMIELLFRSVLMDAALQDISAKVDRVQAAVETSRAVDTERDIMSTVVRPLFPDYLNLY